MNRLRDVIDSPCGLRFMFEELPLSSGCSRSFMLNGNMSGSKEEITALYASLRDFLPVAENENLTGLLHLRLCTLKDIGRSLDRISAGNMVDDIELFEVKHLMSLAFGLDAALCDAGFGILAPDTDGLQEYFDVLDPDGLGAASFYIYDSYSERLAEIRKQLAVEKDMEKKTALMNEERLEEEEVRKNICRSLCPAVDRLKALQRELAIFDITLAKAVQVKKMGLCLPAVSDGGSSYIGMFHPMVKSSLEEAGREYTPVDIEFNDRPVVIIGANMGGKTVVLKTVTLCQYCFSLGMGIPAVSASIEPKEEVFFVSGDAQDLKTGMSSFAAEMKGIDVAVRAAAGHGAGVMAVIDEPARSTNPIEGAAIVAALVDILDSYGATLLLTTHYNLPSLDCIRLRVKGLENGIMNYRLCRALEGDVPHEALNVAESLNIFPEWIGKAKKILEHE